MSERYRLSPDGVVRLSDGAFIPNDPDNRDWRECLAWQAEGNIADPYAPPVQRKLIPKTVIIDRLHIAGKLQAARAALDTSDLYLQERWNTRNAIYADDPDAVALLRAIGAEPSEILAP